MSACMLALLGAVFSAQAAEGREERLQRILQASSPAQGRAPAAPSAASVQRIVAAVKHNLVGVPGLQGNPLVVVRVDVGRDGLISARKVVLSSGVEAWDTAVLKALDKTARLPVSPGEFLPPAMEFHFRPGDRAAPSEVTGSESPGSGPSGTP